MHILSWKDWRRLSPDERDEYDYCFGERISHGLDLAWGTLKITLWAIVMFIIIILLFSISAQVKNDISIMDTERVISTPFGYLLKMGAGIMLIGLFASVHHMFRARRWIKKIKEDWD